MGHRTPCSKKGPHTFDVRSQALDMLRLDSRKVDDVRCANAYHESIEVSTLVQGKRRAPVISLRRPVGSGIVDQHILHDAAGETHKVLFVPKRQGFGCCEPDVRLVDQRSGHDHWNLHRDGR